MVTNHDVLAAVEQFGRELRAKLGTSIESVILFGSQARGSARPSSDVDVAVFVCDGVPLKSFRARISDVAYEFVLRGMDIRPVALHSARRRERSLFMRNIALDGRRVL